MPLAFIGGVHSRSLTHRIAARPWRVPALLTALVTTFLLPRLSAMQVVDEPRTIEVMARRYEFVPATIEAQVGERLRLRVVSEDRLHGFGIDAYGINLVVPRGGRAVTVEFAASRPGVFEILCTEDCGRGHDDMKGVLVVKAVTP